MEIQIISKEIIKPSFSTPDHLRSHKICLLDQLVPSEVHFPFIFFYSAANEDRIKTSVALKHSLSQTLTHYYPFAGRVKDAFSIDCDDSGVTFVEAQVAGYMSEVLKQPEMELLEQLLPCKLDAKLIATAAANFVKNWAAVASCGSIGIKDVIFDSTSIFPPQDVLGITKSVFKKHWSNTEVTAKRFLFDAPKIAALREELSNGEGMDRPTRFEAVTTLILSAVMAATVRETNEFSPTHLAALIPVNLRKRINPPLPQQCIGSLCAATTVSCPIQYKLDHKSLAGKVHESIGMMDDNFVRNVYGGDDFLNFFRNAAEGFAKSMVFMITSWCKLPCFEADFGWGKPKWVATTVRDDKVAMLLDTCDGEGIEAWVGLSKEDMAKFEQDPAILGYASVNPSPF
ncbi:hypothetical protein Patl1_02836 [Pistacia atlantica]|uniref:Uncharacterized protein n=1 Tax=Pistacia atlantica TaxID=434234 RepID=A0ACC1C513_9ROSI|nr:hypothetical protein Patl1_02836 [Pistacia atlantica]